MIGSHCPAPLAPGDIADYWAGDLSGKAADQIEEHIFACEDCARRLAEGEALVRGIAAVVQSGRFHAVVTDAVLNRLARHGARIRSYTLEPGTAVACAVWPDDDLVVARLRADFTGFDAVDVVMRLASDEEISRASNVPVRGARGEIVDAISATRLRQLPSSRVRLTVTGRSGDVTRTLGEYVLDHTADDLGPRNQPH